MVLENPERYNFYKFENLLKKDKNSFIKHIDETLKSNGIDTVLTILKSSGLSVNLFNNSKQKEKVSDIVDHISTQVGKEGIKKIEDFKTEISYFELAFKRFEFLRKEFFSKYETINDEYKVVSYLISLELHLRGLTDESSEFVKNELDNRTKNQDFVERSALFDSAIESTGMILKYFMYNKNDFKGCKRNISPKILEASLTHVIFSELWFQLNDILEYWKYSNVEVSLKEDGKVLFEIVDKEFELNNLVSNERFNNLRTGWQMNRVGEMQKNIYGRKDINLDAILSQSKLNLSYLFSTLYFGSPLLDDKINNIEIKDWIRAYQILIDESEKFLSKQKINRVYNLDKICLSKTVHNWKRLFKQHGFSNESSDVILQFFTFDNKSLDLVDCPFVKVDDTLVILPSLTSQADAARALASNFLNRNVNLDFKGTGFEERSKAGLLLNNIKNSTLYKRTKESEYECDIAFVLDEELFFIECKAHVQPYTTRQHANHLNKLYKETYQINRIADYFERNLSIVREQLKLPESFIPINTHRILLTTSMIGVPLFVNGVYIVDESSFTKFIDREPPSLNYFEKGSYVKYNSTKFEIYNGRLTSQKMIEFLNYPPQIMIAEELYKPKELTLDLFDIKRHYKVNQTIHIGVNIKDVDKTFIGKYY
ncbi:hypothetical protein [Cytobacillus firmus]|uniref:hypothetical protein n=1 Tax=Cytobacillus firmus TaxID=1399 RepID=UPI0018CF8D59|nr:hypothetical protein [Cytobacillus firmus]MBG9586086.1 hypothetical protein [Cytobacillus firmus]